MNDFDIFDLWENDTPKSEFEKLSIEEAIEVKREKQQDGNKNLSRQKGIRNIKNIALK